MPDIQHKKRSKDPITAFFQDHNIPPLFLLLLILALLLPLIVIVLYYLPSGAPESLCGDNVCDSGEPSTCPIDCPGAAISREVRVKVSGNITGIIQISLTDVDSRLITTNTGRIDELLVSGVTTNRVIALITNPLNNMTFRSEVVELIDLSTTIYVTLPPNFFQMGNTLISLRMDIGEVFDETPLNVKVYDLNGRLLSEVNVSDPNNVVLDLGRPLVYIEVTSPTGEKWTSETIDLSVNVIRAEEAGLTTGQNGTSVNETPEGPISWGQVGEPIRRISCSAIGDLNGDYVMDGTDLAYLAAAMSEVQARGIPDDIVRAITCADVNRDGAITNEDYECLASVLEAERADFTECPDCVPDSSIEICNDGLDNNCDGQTDKDDYDEATDSAHLNLCDCMLSTPCEMFADADSVPGASGESGVKRCSIVSTSGDLPMWHTLPDWQCDSGKACDTLTCGGETYTCGCSCDTSVCRYIWEKDNGKTYPLAPLSSDYLSDEVCCPPPSAAWFVDKWGLWDPQGVFATEDLTEMKDVYGLGFVVLPESGSHLDLGALHAAGLIRVESIELGWPDEWGNYPGVEAVRSWAAAAASSRCIDALSVNVDLYSPENYSTALAAAYGEARAQDKALLLAVNCTMLEGSHSSLAFSDIEAYSDILLPFCQQQGTDYGYYLYYISKVYWSTRGVSRPVYPIMQASFGNVTVTEEAYEAVLSLSGYNVDSAALAADLGLLASYKNRQNEYNTSYLFSSLDEDYGYRGFDCG